MKPRYTTLHGHASLPLTLNEAQQGVNSAEIDQSLEKQGQSRWYKFTVQPSSKVMVTLTGLPANYDLALYKDIAEAYTSSTQRRTWCSSAPSSPRIPSARTPSVRTPSPRTPSHRIPSARTPSRPIPSHRTPSPRTLLTGHFSPDTFSPDTFSPDTFCPDTFSPDTFRPDTFSPDTFSPDTFSPDTFSPDTFSSAQTRSLIAVSAHEGTLGEGIIVNTWTKTGDFYVRVRGRNGAFDPDNPFHLEVILLSGPARGQPGAAGLDTTTPDGDYQTLIMTNPNQTEGTQGKKMLADQPGPGCHKRVGGGRGGDARVSAASRQKPPCLRVCQEHGGRRGQGHRRPLPGAQPTRVYCPGGERPGHPLLPLRRYRPAGQRDRLFAAGDGQHHLAGQPEIGLYPQPGYLRRGDELSFKGGSPFPAWRWVGWWRRLPISTSLEAYLGTTDGVVAPANALVTGYDFLEDAADAVGAELQAGLGQQPSIR